MQLEAPRRRRSLASVATMLGAAFVIASRGSLAQTDATPVLTLAEAGSAARRNVPSVLAALAQAHVAEGQLAMARTPLEPFVTGTLAASATGSNSDIRGGAMTCPPGMPTCTSSSNGPLGVGYLDGTVALRWTLWDFGRTSLNVQAARLAAQGALRDVQSAERFAVGAAATAYYALLADEEVVTASRETLQQRERELEIARARVAAGSNPQIDQTRAEIGAETARLDLRRSEATVLNDAASLAIALGLDPAHPPRVARPAEITVDDDPVHAADAAVRARPEVEVARLRLAGAERALAAARAGWRPWLAVTASAGGRFTEYTTGLSILSETALGIMTFNVPIYDPTIRANSRIAEGQMLAARATLAQQTLAVRGEAVQSAIAVHAAHEQLLQAERNATLAAANLALAEGRYNVGAAQVLELVDAQALDATARVAVIQQRFFYERAKVALLAATNRLDVIAPR